MRIIDILIFVVAGALMLLAVACAGCGPVGIDANVPVVVNVNVAAGAFVINLGGIKVDPNAIQATVPVNISINGHVFGATRPAVDDSFEDMDPASVSP